MKKNQDRTWQKSETTGKKTLELENGWGPSVPRLCVCPEIGIP